MDRTANTAHTLRILNAASASDAEAVARAIADRAVGRVADEAALERAIALGLARKQPGHPIAPDHVNIDEAPWEAMLDIEELVGKIARSEELDAADRDRLLLAELAGLVILEGWKVRLHDRGLDHLAQAWSVADVEDLETIGSSSIRPEDLDPAGTELVAFRHSTARGRYIAYRERIRHWTPKGSARLEGGGLAKPLKHSGLEGEARRFDSADASWCVASAIQIRRWIERDRLEREAAILHDRVHDLSRKVGSRSVALAEASRAWIAAYEAAMLEPADAWSSSIAPR